MARRLEAGHAADFLVPISAAVQVLWLFHHAVHARRYRTREVELCQPAHRPIVERLAHQVCIGLDQVQAHIALQVIVTQSAGGALAASGLAHGYLGDCRVHGFIQCFVVCGAVARGFQQLQCHALGDQHGRVSADGLTSLQQLALVLVSGGLRVELALGGRHAVLVQEDHPELHTVTLEQHRPVQPVGQAHAVGLVVIVCAGCVVPEVRGWARHAVHHVVGRQ